MTQSSRMDSEPASFAMDKIYLLSFSDTGSSISETIASKITSQYPNADVIIKRVTSITGYISSIFETAKLLIFIGAAGIAVRAVAPLLKSKVTDPAVIVIDEATRFVIPILSGHIGGANRYACEIAEIIGAAAVITTSTDVNGVFAIDSFAVDNGYSIINPKGIKQISSAMLRSSSVGLYSDFEVIGDHPFRQIYSELQDMHCPDDARPLHGICISLDISKKPFKETLNLVPKCFHIGVGAKKNASAESLDTLIHEALMSLLIPIEAVAAISSISIKKEESAIVSFSNKHRVPFITYSAEELEAVSHMFLQSSFVKSATGTGNVCEAAAFLSSRNGDIVFPKTAENGITIAIAQESWRVSFGTGNGRSGS